MSDQEPGDDLRIEDIRAAARPGAGVETRGSGPPHDPYAPRRPAPSWIPPSLHRAVRPLRLVGILVLAAVVMLAAIPTLRTGVIGWAQLLLPAPTPTLMPGADRFFLVPAGR